MKTYMLTDGQEIFNVRTMTEAELAEADEKAKANTAGNLQWEEANGRKIVKGMTSRQHSIALSAIIDGKPIGEAIEIAKTF